MDITINDERFSPADVQVTFLGRTVMGIAQIDYKESQEVEDVRVTGNRKPAGYTRGGFSYEGELTLLHEEALALKVAAGGSILNLKPFPITITKIKNGLIIKETLVGVIFKENARSIQGGAIGALQDRLPFKFFDLK